MKFQNAHRIIAEFSPMAPCLLPGTGEGGAMHHHNGEGHGVPALWFGLAIGAAIGLGIALSRTRRHSRWDSARQFGERLAEHKDDFAQVGNNILDRVRTIYDESRKVVEEAGELWTHGRKLVHR
jgi:hypothetical protein